jgi:pimeloyl-ACP methyl ester carboxylesterase
MRSHFISAPDGLMLHAAEFGDRTSPRLPAVCLPGLARTAADFDSLAEALASDAKSPRRVVAIDYRGRGRSAYDRDPTNYTYATELGDLEAVLTALDVGPAVFIGTSRGGILTMLLAALSPTRIAGAVLNDIGPVIEPNGLMRIKGYVGKLPQPASWSDAAGILKRMFDAQFPKLTGEDWLAAARLTWRDDDGGLTLNYDPRLARTLDAIDPEKPVPELWPQFEALAHAPLMVIRGTLSDLLSEATVSEMRRRRRKIEVVDVADEGHPPRLGTPELIRRIAQFARACDEARRA